MPGEQNRRPAELRECDLVDEDFFFRGVVGIPGTDASEFWRYGDPVEGSTPPVDADRDYHDLGAAAAWDVSTN